jgi:NAD(P)H dehydrogenase (quinone)
MARVRADFAHAGQERVVDDLNAVGAAWGCVLVPPGTANTVINRLDGNPYGLSFVLEHGRIVDVDVATEVLGAHLGRFAAVTDAVATLRRPAARLAPPTAAEVLG